jgi:hypothetical protein
MGLRIIEHKNCEKLRKRKIIKDQINAICNGHSSRHSAQAITLPIIIINELEARKIPYVLTAMPGEGYFIETYFVPVGE